MTVLILAVVLAAAIVSPAVGGPSFGKVAKKAQKALKIGKKANRRAARAQREAGRANSAATGARGVADEAANLAGAANGKADQALARPVVTVNGITAVENSVTVPASDIAATAAVCPAGQRTISGGVVSAVPLGGTWGDKASDERTGWLGAAENLSDTEGDLYVYAYCAPANQAVAASRFQTRRTIRRELRVLRNSR